MELKLSRRDFGLAAAGVVAMGATAMPGFAGAADAGGDWLDIIKAQHQELDRLLAAVKSAGSHEARVAAFKRFSVYLFAHCLAEEVTVYPALAITGSESASKQLYGEQDGAKVLVARVADALAAGHDSDLPAMLDTLGTALHAHVAEEENRDFPPLKAKEDAATNTRLTSEFKATFRRASA